MGCLKICCQYHGVINSGSESFTSTADSRKNLTAMINLNILEPRIITLLRLRSDGGGARTHARARAHTHARDDENATLVLAQVS